MRDSTLCLVPYCPNPIRARSLCSPHYQRVQNHGTTELIGHPRTWGTGSRAGERLSESERFWSKVNADGDCWLWLGSLNVAGYGRFDASGRRTGVHRYAYEALVGPIPPGLDIDHLCRVRNCVNPDHLEPVTPAENTRRARRVLRSRSCPNQHPYTEATIKWYLGKRICRICLWARRRAIRAKRRARARLAA